MRKAQNREPYVKEMAGFASLFLRREANLVAETVKAWRWKGVDEPMIIDSLLNSKPQFDGYENFLNYVDQRYNNCNE